MRSQQPLRAIFSGLTASFKHVGGGPDAEKQRCPKSCRQVEQQDCFGVIKPSMLLDEAAEKTVSEHYARLWTSLKLRFTAKYFSEGALLSNSALHPPNPDSVRAATLLA